MLESRLNLATELSRLKSMWATTSAVRNQIMFSTDSLTFSIRSLPRNENNQSLSVIHPAHFRLPSTSPSEQRPILRGMVGRTIIQLESHLKRLGRAQAPIK